MPGTPTTIHFSNRVQALFDGTPVDLPARRSDWVEFSFDEPQATFKESIYGGGEGVVSVSTKGTLTVRALASSKFIRDTVPALIQKNQEEGYFDVSVNDENDDSKLAVTSESALVIKEGDVKRGGPELDEVEVQFTGVWSIIR